MEPPAIQIGKNPVELNLTGQSLNLVTEVVFSCAAKTEIVSQSPNGQQLVLRVSGLDPSEAGINQFRLVGKSSVSPWMRLPVDRLPNKKIVADQPLELGKLNSTAVYGRISGQQKAIVTFSVEKGQTLFFESESTRLGTSLRPQFILLDANGRQVDWSQPDRILDGDTRLIHQFAESGTYRLEFFDQLMKAPGNSFFRLKIGNFLVADQLLPTGKGWLGHVNHQPDTNATLIQSLAGNEPSLPARYQGDKVYTGWRRTVLHALGREYMEFDDVALPKEMALPFAVSGQLTTANEIDKYSVPAEGRVFISVLAARIGSPLDATVKVFNRNNQMIGSSDDSGGSRDPEFAVNVPKGAGPIRIEVSNLLGHGGKPFNYRLEVGSDKGNRARLTIDRDHLFLVPGSYSIVQIKAIRNGQAGPIPLNMSLPEGCDYFPKQIPAGTDSTFVVVWAASKVPAQTFRVFGTILDRQAKSIGNSIAEIEQRAANKEPVWMKTFATVSTGEAHPVTITTSKPKRSFFFPALQKVTISVNRKNGYKNKLRLSLATNQQLKMVKVKNKDVPDPKWTVRLLQKNLDLEAGVDQKSCWIYAPENGQPVDFVVQAKPLRLMITDPRNPFAQASPFFSNPQSLRR